MTDTDAKFKPMNPALKGPWLEALRSGEFQQGFGGLHVTDENGGTIGHCCLGVLSEVACNLGLAEKKASNGFNNMYRTKGSDPTREVWSAVMPGQELEGLFGLDAGVSSKLAEMNDGPGYDTADANSQGANGKTFVEIADWIEENL